MKLVDFAQKVSDAMTGQMIRSQQPIRMSCGGETYDIGDIVWDPTLDMFIIEEA